jgi:hypothetical protein
MVNIKSLSSTDPKLGQLRDSELFRISDHNNLYLRTQSVNRRILCSTVDLKYGVGTSLPALKMDIDDVNGQCLNLLRNGAQTATLTINSLGSLDINGSNGVSINSLALDTSLASAYGGTGQTEYLDGDILVGSNNGLMKINKSSSVGMQLITTPNGLEWSSHVIGRHLFKCPPRIIGQGIYIIDMLLCRNHLDTNFISLENVEVNAMTKRLSSAALGNAVITTDVTNISLDGNNFIANDALCVGSEARKIIAATPTSVTVSSAFTLYNKWVLSGTAALATTQFKFGTRSLNTTTTTMFATATIGSSIAESVNAWTVEFFFRASAVTAALSLVASNAVNTLAINLAASPANITVSLGQGATFNIMNAVRLATTAITANAWFHFALSYDGSNYRSFINGVLQNTTASTLLIPLTTFDSIKVGGGASTYNGFIDEFRISRVARYTAAFSQPTAIFSLDSNTVYLQHFETLLDDNGSGTVPYFRNVSYDSVHLLYTYAIENNCYVSPRPNETLLVDLPFVTDNIRKLHIYHLMTSGVPYVITKHGEWHMFQPFISGVSASTATTATTYYANNITPSEATMLKLLVTHNHVGTVSCGVSVGSGVGWFNPYLTTTTAGSTQLIVDIPIFNGTFQHYLTASASTTSYSISVVGFFVPSES